MTNVGENQGDEIFIHETVKREMFAHFFLRKVFLERDEIGWRGSSTFLKQKPKSDHALRWSCMTLSMLAQVKCMLQTPAAK